MSHDDVPFPPAEEETDSQDLAIGAPESIIELSLAAARFVHGAVGIEIDQTSDTLSLVDHYLVEARGTLEERPELVPLITRSVGAYFGEVIRPLLNGFWIVPSDDVHGWLVCSHDVFLSLNPVGAVYDALYGHRDHDGPSSELRLDREDAALVDQRLSLLPEVREEDFHLLTTRFDVVEIAVSALREAASRDGHQEVRFELDDYLTTS
ncbi:MAG: hypothetical protein H6718_07340 [Polyangiaceae bacterium]|nr:hypothetical protein [Polyangiaceae bacterium]